MSRNAPERYAPEQRSGLNSCSRNAVPVRKLRGRQMKWIRQYRFWLWKFLRLFQRSFNGQQRLMICFLNYATMPVKNKTADHRRTPQHRRPPQDCQENCRTHLSEQGGIGSKTAEQQCRCRLMYIFRVIVRQTSTARRLRANYIQTYILMYLTSNRVIYGKANHLGN